MPVTICNYVLNAGAGGKFVVMVRPDDPEEGIVAFSDFSRDFQHHDIVVRWERGVGTTVAEAGMRLAGGGWWRYADGRLVLYGQSAAYGRFDPAWIRDRLRPGTVLEETSIDVL